MTDKFKNTYRISSARATWWDYNADAAYFATICTKDHISYFGDVIDGVMALSEIGNITQQCWEQIPIHFPFVILDEFVVMPNHVHGIIVIDKGDDYVETRLIASLQGGITKNKNPMLADGLPKIIRWFKGKSSYEIRKTHADFAWQSRYHDRIIRDQ